MTFNHRTSFAAAAVLALAACGGNSTVPPPAGVAAPATEPGMQRLDNTSILKKLTKDVVIGSTVDPTNGDQGPHSISLVQNNYVLKKGQLVVCNFADKTGTAGQGSTIEVLDPKPGSSPVTFARYKAITGCAGAATTDANDVHGAGLTSGLDVAFSAAGKLSKRYGTPIKAPFSNADVRCTTAISRCLYAAEYIFVSDAGTGSLVSFSINNIGHPNELAVVGGFAVNGQQGWSALGPSGLSYYYPADTIYVADGVDNAIVGITHTSNLLVKDEVVVQPGGTTFKCKYHGSGDPCGVLVKAGSPLNAPVAMTVLPNGNLVAANTQGPEMLVELTPTGTVLATKTLGKTPHIFGLASRGTNDNNTVLFYTDNKHNTVHELEQ
ncbi:MAG: hypothetical protein JO113_03055 [Candidatus Eremiobacteraeota bacterium]|nr:hypothetical protein [Candidatus Eremiobacteraeota bacterium]